MPSNIFANSSAFQHLLAHVNDIKETTISQLFEQEPERFTQFSLEAAGLFLDYSKNRLTGTTRDLLLQLAEQQHVEQQRDAMFAGQKVNFTEQRAVLHTALRAPKNQPHFLDGTDINQQIHGVLEQMRVFTEQIHRGEKRGVTGLRFTDIVNIGIGGSDLGPKMVCHALRNIARPDLRMHFVSNVDGHALDAVLRQLNPASTLFIIASKTFTTADTMLNAHSAKRWFLTFFSDAGVSHHFVAVSSNPAAVSQFGIDQKNRFDFWDWVGGRYSLWSAIGLPIALALGFEHFRALLDGACAMDQHFQHAPLAQNMPVLLALTGIWNRNFEECGSISIATYHQDLLYFPNFLQQLDMESNGKCVNRHGQATQTATAPVIWGDVGTNGQHAYFQFLHQGADITPVDFITCIRPQHALPEHHTTLLANCLAQSKALMLGKTTQQAEEELQEQGLSPQQIALLAPHRTFPGNRPSNTILMDTLSPSALGALIALYEHKVTVQGFCWGINSFDQWGVELGKVLAKSIAGTLISSEPDNNHDGSTKGLIARIRERQKSPP